MIDTLLLLKFLAVFTFVITLMLLLSWGLKRMGLGNGVIKKAAQRRLKIVEFLPIDHKRRLVLVRRDNREHLLVLGPDGETVVETGIEITAEEEAERIVSFSRDQRNVKI